MTATIPIAQLATLELPKSEVIFDEPWQAQAFATTVLLNKQGLLDWNEWVKTFAHHIASAPKTETEIERFAYYRQWLSALEEILDSSYFTQANVRALYQDCWRRSYQATEHGEAVVFRKDLIEALDHDHDHDHDHHHSHSQAKPKPIFVCAARG